MKKSKKVKYPTPTEIIATISRSSFPAIVTEGDDDVIVWRRLEDKFIEAGVTLIPAGGRDAVLEVYRRRGELPNRAIAMFLADLDCWSLSEIPDQYVAPQIVFTKGYSLENDMFVDGNLADLLVGQEKFRFANELEQVVRWYALAADRFLRGEDESLDVHPNELLDDDARMAILMAPKPGESYPDTLHSQIKSNAQYLLRGKTLLALLIRHAKGYSYRILLNVGASQNGPCFCRIEEEVGSYLNLSLARRDLWPLREEL